MLSSTRQDLGTIQSLRQIIQTGNAIKAICSVPSHDSPISSPPSPIPFSLPPPPSIHLKLVDLGLQPHVVEKLCQKYDLRSQEIQLLSRNCILRAWQELSRLPTHPGLMTLPQLFKGVVAAHTASYIQALEKLESRAMTIAEGWKSRLETRRKPKTLKERPSFNAEFTPFLEKYFEYNAYPSSADKKEMAKKSMMEPRQITVWFQNHRARAKKEGKVLRSLSPADPAPFNLCLKSMEEKMEPYLIPEALRQSVDDDEVSEPESDEEEEEDDEFYNEKSQDEDTSDVLNPPAARHAFPVPFSRGKHMVSTITWTQEFSFPPPVWPRKASSPTITRPAVPMDELVVTFAKFHVRDGTKVFSPFPNGQNAATSAITVVPSPAPHPAFLRASFVPSSVLASTSLNIIPAPRTGSRQHVFRSPSPFSELATLVPSARRKKVAGPPRRTPKRPARTDHRGASPAISETSTLRSCSPPSRTSSFSSSTSPSRVPSFDSSSSRSSSASSSGPTTPTGSPSALPLDETDFSHVDIFGEPLQQQQYASPVEDTTPPMSFKKPFRYSSHPSG
ncbi:hypothetical protein C8J57DRAFT_1161620 [Mycena rebaudengoi]|nr:hypothetical protein C8J57DRAFT_1161620 [Mycena rebaudengoi]